MILITTVLKKGISPWVLRECCVQFFLLLFTKSLAQSKLTHTWKKGKHYSDLQKGDVKQTHNYRPKSITLILMKSIRKSGHEKLLGLI